MSRSSSVVITAPGVTFSAKPWRSVLGEVDIGARLQELPAPQSETPHLQFEALPFQIQLANADFRAARWVLEQGGNVGLHGGASVQDLADLVDRQMSLQRAEFKNTAVATAADRYEFGRSLSRRREGLVP